MASCLCLPFPGPSPVQHHARRRSGHLCILCLCCLTYDVGDTGTIENSKSLWKVGSFSSQHEIPQRDGFSPSLGAPPHPQGFSLTGLFSPCVSLQASALPSPFPPARFTHTGLTGELFLLPLRFLIKSLQNWPFTFREAEGTRGNQRAGPSTQVPTRTANVF